MLAWTVFGLLSHSDVVGHGLKSTQTTVPNIFAGLEIFGLAGKVRVFHALLAMEANGVMQRPFPPAPKMDRRGEILVGLFDPFTSDGLHKGLSLWPKSLG